MNDGADQYATSRSIQRLQRRRDSPVAGSLLSASAAAALASVGLEPVNEVMGCYVAAFRRRSFGCPGGGASVTRGANVLPPIPSRVRVWAGLRPYVHARYTAYDSAMNRMIAQAKGLGADGVVGVRLTWTRLGPRTRALTVIGTAVKERRLERRRPENALPYLTDLSAEDLTKLVLAGWIPLGIAVGLSVGVRHDVEYPRPKRQLAGRVRNYEDYDLTKVIQDARSGARHTLAVRARQFPGAPQVIVTTSGLLQSTQRCSSRSGSDHVIEASYFGTVLARDPRPVQPIVPSHMSILPLNSTIGATSWRALRDLFP